MNMYKCTLFECSFVQVSNSVRLWKCTFIHSPLSHIFHPIPFRGFTFYKMANLDNRISNADQLLTQASTYIHTCHLLGSFVRPSFVICVWAWFDSWLLSPSQDVEKFTETLGELYSNILKVLARLYVRVLPILIQTLYTWFTSHFLMAKDCA